jgi:hypothetical protein
MKPGSQLRIAKWDDRHWAVYDGPDLVCVTVYKRGALEVKRRLENVTSRGVETSSSPEYIQPTVDSSPAALSTIV